MNNLLNNGGFETADEWILSSELGQIDLNDPQNAYSGNGHARLTPDKTKGVTVRQENIILQPDTKYLLTYHVRPYCTGIIVPTSYSLITATLDDDKPMTLGEAPRVPLIKNQYMKRQYFFTTPNNSAPITARVIISVLSHSTVGDYVFYDDVSLVQTNINPNPLYGRYAWVTNVNEKVYEEAGKPKVAFLKNTNDCLIIYARTVVHDAEWLYVRDMVSQCGWIRSDRLTWIPPQ